MTEKREVGLLDGVPFIPARERERQRAEAAKRLRAGLSPAESAERDARLRAWQSDRLREALRRR